MSRRHQVHTIGHKSVQLFKDQTIGIGAYGKVCKAKCDNLTCAAKLIHETLLDPMAHFQLAPQREHSQPMRRFQQECEFLSTIRHPNIILYLGMHRDGDTGLPVLLMELMDDSLTHFLESSTKPVPYHIQVNICHDIAQALSFLHSNEIVHRDLSSNNVLLHGNVIAKVTDFGMARLVNINPNFTKTQCPGTDVYMPPEAIKDKPVYTEKIDCFSFGVVTLQILTKLFPKPGDRVVTINDPRYPRAIKMDVPEINRRQNHIIEVDPSHPLLPVVLDCLKDDDSERPSADQLCEKTEVMKKTIECGDPRYRLKSDADEMFQDIVFLRDQLHAKQRDIQQKDLLLATEQQQLNLCRMQIQRLHQANRQLEIDKDQAIQERIEKERQLSRINYQLEECEKALADSKKHVAELQRQINQRYQTQTSHDERSTSDSERHQQWNNDSCAVDSERDQLYVQIDDVFRADDEKSQQHREVSSTIEGENNQPPIQHTDEEFGGDGEKTQPEVHHDDGSCANDGEKKQPQMNHGDEDFESVGEKNHPEIQHGDESFRTNAEKVQQQLLSYNESLGADIGKSHSQIQQDNSFGSPSDKYKPEDHDSYEADDEKDQPNVKCYDGGDDEDQPKIHTDADGEKNHPLIHFEGDDEKTQSQMQHNENFGADCEQNQTHIQHNDESFRASVEEISPQIQSDDDSFEAHGGINQPQIQHDNSFVVESDRSQPHGDSFGEDGEKHQPHIQHSDGRDGEQSQPQIQCDDGAHVETIQPQIQHGDDFGGNDEEIQPQVQHNDGFGADGEKNQPQIQVDDSHSEEVLKLRWRGEEKTLCGIVRYFDAVIGGRVVYCAYVRDPFSKEEIHAYDHTTSNWSRILPCQVYAGFSITVINGLLTTIGGYGNDNKDTNKLFSLTNAGDEQWTEQFPPMPSKRYNVSALCTDASLIVVGGRKGNGVCVKSVEVMNVQTRQWHTTNPLPERLSCSSMTLCGDHIFLLGGVNKHGKWTQSVYSCLLASILVTQGSRVVQTISRSNSSNDTWTRVTDLSVTQSTAVCLQGQLIAVGGCDANNRLTANIHRYNPDTDSWKVVNHMATPRRRCNVAVLPDNKLMILGGFISENETTDSVEIGQVYL